MPEPLLPVLLLDCLHPNPLFVKHDKVVLVLARDHLFDPRFFDLVFKSLIISNYIFFKPDHEILYSDQKVFHILSILVQHSLALLLQG